MVFTRKPDFKSPTNMAESGRIPTSPAQLIELQAGTEATFPPEAPSVIGNDLSIEGQSITIRCKGALRINGNIQADMHSKKLIVGQQAVIIGAIAANEVDVYGRVEGAIYGTNVRLHQSAQVDGDIHSQHLQIEAGAAFDGRSRKVQDVSEIAPRLESERPAAVATPISQDKARAPTQPSGAMFQSIVTPPAERQLHG